MIDVPFLERARPAEARVDNGEVRKLQRPTGEGWE